MRTLLEESQEWLVDRVIEYSKRHQFAKETSTLREAWRRSIEGLSDSVIQLAAVPAAGIEEAGEQDDGPATRYVVPVSRKHRAWGVSLRQFLALFKYYRKAYLDLLGTHPAVRRRRRRLTEAVGLAFDRLEIAMVSAWEAVPSAEADQELRAANRFQTREKNKYLTIFESLREPVFFIAADGSVENLNAAASRTFGRSPSPGGTYYSRRLDLHWPTPADIPELLASASRGVFERNLPTANGDCWFEVKASAMLDVSGKFTGSIVTCTETTERRRAARIIDESERRYRGLFQSMTSGFALHEMIFDEAGRSCDYRFLEVNRAFEALTGLKAADIIGRTVLEVLPDTEPFWIKTYGDVARGSQPVQFENYSQQLDRHFEVVAYSPRPGHFATICRDISERKRGEERLKESESRMRAVLDGSPLAIITISLDGRIQSWNAAASAMFGWAAADAVGRRLISLFPGMGMSFAAIRRSVLKNNGPSGTVRKVQRRNGTDIWVSISAAPIVGEKGSAVALVAEIEDVTVRRRTEMALRESETMFRQIAETLGEAIWLRDSTGIVYISPGFERIWGRPRDDLYRDSQAFIASIVPEDRDRILQSLKSPTLVQQGRFDEEYRIVRPDGSIRWIWARTFPIRESGSALRVGIAEDITDRKTYEAQLIEAKSHAEAAKRSQSEFLANMSHELRTPLNSILGFSEIMAGQMLGPIGIERYLDYAKDIHSSGRLLLDIINDILDLSRVEVGTVKLNRQTCDATAILQAVGRILGLRAAERGLTFAVDQCRAAPPLDADPLRLKQILLNLGSNAIKFTRRGGRVSLQAFWNETDGHVFVVTDTGIGMTAAEIEVALRPFGQVAAAQRRGYQGTGLGLPIAESLVRLHGGTLRIESAPGEGTTVKISLPATGLPDNPMLSCPPSADRHEPATCG